MKKLFLISMLVFMFSGQVWGEECKYVWVSDSGTTPTPHWIVPEWKIWPGTVFIGWNVEDEFPKWQKEHKEWEASKIWETTEKGYFNEPLWTVYKYCKPEIEWDGK